MNNVNVEGSENGEENSEFDSSASAISYRELNGLAGDPTAGWNAFDHGGNEGSENDDGNSGRSRKRKRGKDDTVREYISFAQARRKLNDTNPEEALGERIQLKRCWACQHGLLLRFPDPNFVAPDFDTQICKFIKESAMKMKREYLIDEIGALYEKVIVPFYAEYKNKDLGPWTPSEIEEHFFVHVKDPALFVRKQLDRIHELQEMQLNRINYIDEDGVEKISQEAVKTYMFLVESERKIMMTNTINSIAYDPELTQVLAKNRGKKEQTQS